MNGSDWDVTSPISMRLAGWLGWRHEREESLPTGKLRNIRFSNIRARVADNSYPMEHEGPRTEGEEKSCINITGLEGHNVENITLSNVHVTFPGGGTVEEANRMDVPELEDHYPEYQVAIHQEYLGTQAIMDRTNKIPGLWYEPY